MTVAADAVALNVIYHEGLLCVYGLIDNDEKVASSTQFTTRVQKPYTIYAKNGQNRYPIYDQKG